MTPPILALLLLAAFALGRLSATMPARRSPDVEDTDDTRAFGERIRERREMGTVAE